MYNYNASKADQLLGSATCDIKKLLAENNGKRKQQNFLFSYFAWAVGPRCFMSKGKVLIFINNRIIYVVFIVFALLHRLFIMKYSLLSILQWKEWILV